MVTITYGKAAGGTGTVNVDLSAVDVTSATAVVTAIRTALNLDAGFAAEATATDGAGADAGSVVITYTDAGFADIATNVSLANASQIEALAGAATEATKGAAAIAEVTTVTLTDGTVNAGLSLGDTMSLTVGGKVFTYTAEAATVTMDDAATALAALIQADAAVITAAYNTTTNVMTITAATAGAAGLGVTGYAVVDASSTALGDTLNGGAGNDILVANAGLSKLTGGGRQRPVRGRHCLAERQQLLDR